MNWLNAPTVQRLCVYGRDIPGYKQQLFGSHSAKPSYDFAGLVLDYNPDTQMATLQQRTSFKPGYEIEFFGPEIENFSQKVGIIWDEDGNELDTLVIPLQIVHIKVDHPVFVNNMMRKENES